MESKTNLHSCRQLETCMMLVWCVQEARHALTWSKQGELSVCSASQRRCGFSRSCSLPRPALICSFLLLKSTIISFVLLTLTERLLSLLQLSGCLTSSPRCRQQKWWSDRTDVWRCSHGSAVFVMKGVVTVWGLLISKSRTHIRREESVLLCYCVWVCVCVATLFLHSYQLLNHPSNYRGNRASITPSIIQGRQTERQNAARDVTDEWRDNKKREEERRGGWGERGF